MNLHYNLHYRLANAGDLDEICLLIHNAIYEMEAHGIFQWDDLYPIREDFQEDIEKQSLFLALDGDRLAAIYVINGEADEEYNNAKWECPDGTSYVLHRFCVSPSYQNRGIGKRVLLHLEEQIENMGYESVRLDVFSENPSAQKLYRANGYEVRGFANWRKGRFDLMEKGL